MWEGKRGVKLVLFGEGEKKLKKVRCVCTFFVERGKENAGGVL